MQIQIQVKRPLLPKRQHFSSLLPMRGKIVILFFSSLSLFVLSLLLQFFLLISSHLISSATTAGQSQAKPVMEEKKRFHVPAFGNWDLCDEVPMTQYFESAVHAHYFPLEEERDLFQVPLHFIPAYYNYNHQTTTTTTTTTKKSGKGGVEKQSKVCDVITEVPKRSRAPKAVDEDLYKIPPELLCKKPKRKRIAKSFWSGCLGISCIP